MGLKKMHLNRVSLHMTGVFLLLTGLFMAGPYSKAAGDELQIDADSLEVMPQSGDSAAKGNVRLQYQDIVLRAENLRLNRITKDFEANGNVEIHKANDSWLADRITGNLETGEFATDDSQSYLDPWFAQAAGTQRRQDGSTVFRDVKLSTCEYLHDHEEHYSMNARRVVYFPDGSFRAYNVIVRVRGIPVFYLPMIASGTEFGNLGGLTLSVGHDSRSGAYLFVEQDFQLRADLTTRMMLHLRSKSGIALGNLTNLKTERSNTEMLLYGMRDSNPPETIPGFNRRFESEENRYRVRLKHRTDFTDSLTLRLQADAFSDIEMLEDWFRKEYRKDPQPKSFANLSWATERMHAGLTARARVNDFFTVSEQLPELRLDFPRQQLGDSGFYYQGESSISYLRTKWRKFDLARPGLADPRDYAAMRFDSLHMLYRPFQFSDKRIQFIPRAGVRLTHYSRSSDLPLNTAALLNLFAVDNPDDPDNATVIANYDSRGGSKTRVTGEFGFELSTKFFKTWKDMKNERFSIDGLRHIVQPYVNYTIMKPSDKPDRLYFFDETDRLEKQNFVRLGMRQRLQTRRNRQIYTLASMENYADFHFTSANNRHTLGDFGTRLEFNPSELVSLWADMLVEMNNPDIRQAGFGISLKNAGFERWNALLGYYYRDDYVSNSVQSMGSTLTDYSGSGTFGRVFEKGHYLTAEFRMRLTDKMVGSIGYEYDLDRNQVSRQWYELLRDLHCWIGSLRLEEADSDLRIMLAFYLKALPNVKLGSGF